MTTVISPEEEANRLRAGVLGSIDGITSTAAVVVGVAGAGASRSILLLTGMVTLIGGALSMGGGEWTSVSAGRDAEVVDGVPAAELASPWSAALASGVSFAVGALVPVLAVVLPPVEWRVPVTFGAVAVALAVAGVTSARMAGTPVRVAVRRTMLGGGVAMLATWGFGLLAG